MLQQTYPFKLPPLPYAYEALEPYIDAETLYYHHDKHFQTYITNLNTALAKYPFLHSYTLEELLRNPDIIPSDIYTAVINNGGGTYNHDVYFKNLAPSNSGRNVPQENLLKMINQTFGSYDEFKILFMEKALAVFGSGYACLMLNKHGLLEIVQRKNQDTVLKDGGQPILLIDVWEHAYYLKYKNERKEYLNKIWNVVNYPSINLV